eukprot:369012_1
MSTALSLVDSLITKIDSSNDDEKYDKDSAVTVTYWAGRGLCEPIRLLLAGIGVKFENIFMQNKKEFDDLRASKKLAYNQLPLVQMDGKYLVQSGSAFRYIANKYNFMGTNLSESYIIDLICEGCKDARATGKLTAFPWSQDVNVILQSFRFERYFQRWEQILIESNNSDGYFVKSGVSAADTAVFEVLEFLELIVGENEFNKRIKSYPKLLRNYKVTRKLGDIEFYIKNKRNHLDWKSYAATVDKTLAR